MVTKVICRSVNDDHERWKNKCYKTPKTCFNVSIGNSLKRLKNCEESAQHFGWVLIYQSVLRCSRSHSCSLDVSRHNWWPYSHFAKRGRAVICKMNRGWWSNYWYCWSSRTLRKYWLRRCCYSVLRSDTARGNCPDFRQGGSNTHNLVNYYY